MHWNTVPFRVPYGHTDQMGHVYYGNYLLYFEIARNEYMRNIGLSYKECEEEGYFVPVVESHVNYRGRVLYDDLIEIHSAMEIASRTRLRCIYKITRAGSDKILTEGYTVHAVVSENGKVLRIPEKIVEMIDKLNQDIS